MNLPLSLFCFSKNQSKCSRKLENNHQSPQNNQKSFEEEYSQDYSFNEQETNKAMDEVLQQIAMDFY